MCYKVFNQLKTFAVAEMKCANEGGTLAMPKTQRVQDFLEILMQQSDKPTFWIGMVGRSFLPVAEHGCILLMID